MAYLVLARKYRPECFADMIGQEHVTRTIRNAIKEDRVHHAYLFCGVRGLGKTTAARILAKCLVCEKGPTAEPCNQCEQCNGVTEGRSVDVIEIDGASNNSVDDVRRLREQVNYLPQSARQKIYIIDEVHMLSTSAFNALLKTLEEPPPHVTFIFATTDPHKVLPTIMSRVSRLDFRRVRTPELVAHLRKLLASEGIEADDDALHLVAQAAEGSVRDALTLLDKAIAFAADPGRVLAEEVRTILGCADRFAIADLLDAVFARDAKATVARFDEITRSGSDLLQLAISILRHLRDLTVVKLCGTRDVLVDVSDGLYERLESQAAELDSAVLSQHFDRFSRVLEGLETSQVPRLVVEMGLLDLVSAEPLIPMGDLIERLRVLGAGSGGGGDAGSGQPRPRDGGEKTRRAAPSKKTTTAEAPTVASDSAPEPEPAPTAPPAPNTATSATPPVSALAKQLWGMVGETLADTTGDSPAETPAVDGFVLTPPTEEPETPAPSPALDEAGCPSSRCTPREPIPWEELEPIAAWEALLDRIRGEDDHLFAVLGGLGLAQLEDGVLELAGARNSFAREQLEAHPELRASLSRFMEDAFGRAFELSMLDATPGLPELPSLSLLEEERARARQAEVEGRARQNTTIRALLAAFDGQLRSVKPLDGAPGEPG